MISYLGHQVFLHIKCSRWINESKAKVVYRIGILKNIDNFNNTNGAHCLAMAPFGFGDPKRTNFKPFYT
jgi:hypothetical protein